MQIGSELVGRMMKEYQAEITWRQTTNYAAAVQDVNPLYFDDRREAGLIAPPLFPVAITWPIVANIYEYLDLGYPPEILMRMVHYSEYMAIHRPVRPGDRLSITGTVAAVLPESKGTHVIFKFPALDKVGAPVFTEYIGGLLRGVGCTDAGRSIDGIPVVPAAHDGADSVWEAERFIPPEAPYLYDGCTGIVFPIHTSPAFAGAVGLPGIIYHGTATLAHAARELVHREAGGDSMRVRAVGCRFRGMVIAGTAIRIQLLRRRQTGSECELFFRVLNDAGKEAVSGGWMALENR